MLALWDEDHLTQLHLSIRDVETGAEQTVVTTPNHPFFVQTTRQVADEATGYAGPLADGHWLYAATLQAGDRLLNADGTWAEVLGAETINQPLLAYNLTVEGFHTYFVAANEDAAPVWVHNSCFFDAPSDVISSAKVLGLNLNPEIIDGVAKLNIAITWNIRPQDFIRIRNFLRSKGVQRVELNTGTIVEAGLIDALSAAADNGTRFLGGTVNRAPNDVIGDFVINFDL